MPISESTEKILRKKKKKNPFQYMVKVLSMF